MGKTRLLDLRYMAGFFDGEGCISICMRRDRLQIGTRPYRVRIHCTNTVREPLVLFQKAFGGAIVTNAHKKRPDWKPGYRWICPSESKLRFLEEVGRSLLVKASQVKLAKEFLKSEKDIGGRIYREMRGLNLRGVRYV